MVNQDPERVSNALFEAQRPGSNGRYQAEYAVINAGTGEMQLVQAGGKTYFELDGSL